MSVFSNHDMVGLVFREPDPDNPRGLRDEIAEALEAGHPVFVRGAAVVQPGVSAEDKVVCQEGLIEKLRDEIRRLQSSQANLREHIQVLTRRLRAAELKKGSHGGDTCLVHTPRGRVSRKILRETR